MRGLTLFWVSSGSAVPSVERDALGVLPSASSTPRSGTLRCDPYVPLMRLHIGSSVQPHEVSVPLGLKMVRAIQNNPSIRPIGHTYLGKAITLPSGRYPAGVAYVRATSRRSKAYDHEC